MQYGMPYKGSKNKLAEWVVSCLPAADTFVDLFAGGCAVTHAALLSGKWERVVCNDRVGTPLIFREAIRGDFDGLGEVLDRAGFALSEDAALRLLYSFGNDARTYLWGGTTRRSRSRLPVCWPPRRCTSAGCTFVVSSGLCATMSNFGKTQKKTGA